jgi:asparagine synthase (glutamine-hydrolysing)
LPSEIIQRSKKGFELPLRAWLTNQLREKIELDWLSAERISDEGILNGDEVSALLSNLHSKHPGDSAAKVWALVVFEKWLEKYRNYIT